MSFQRCRVYFVSLILFLMEISVSTNKDPDQTSHDVAYLTFNLVFNIYMMVIQNLAKKAMIGNSRWSPCP